LLTDVPPPEEPDPPEEPPVELLPEFALLPPPHPIEALTINSVLLSRRNVGLLIFT
jgi:hypothetical protein